MPTNNVQVLLAQDIPDPTDFTATNLRQLDASFQCTICGEFFDAPISLACGHCFCSLCVREHILREPECPRCRKSTTEAHFRVNPALEEAVSAWKAARYEIVLSPSSDSDIACVAGPSKPNASSEIADSSPLRAKSARKASRRRASIEPSSDPREEELEPDSLVECPICGRSVKFQVINAHMDGPDCGQKSHSKTNNPSNPNSKVEWSRVFGGESSKGKNKNNSDLDDPMERLPKVSYDVVKDKTLKELLSSQRLPVGGDRNTRIARHRRWVMMYNANLDKVTGCKTLSGLRHELRTWEEGQKGSKYAVDDPPAHEVSLFPDRSDSIDEHTLKASYMEEFSRLVEEMRQRTCNRPASSDVVRRGVAEDSP
ncbi:hypothetical protein L210DRAFT_962372 [Boletus edulis BED1]|uniref:Postreplication repair E3 ubiquitin-protein ligase RAD18 n=1 Tax=Boletus edulis BED1 TaxID=1328754 RepID=A0AAD4G9Q1_BOLED|nr:hypothetical protein L210DRAFT_962372 [Boletus edulis BED1]